MWPKLWPLRKTSLFWTGLSQAQSLIKILNSITNRQSFFNCRLSFTGYRYIPHTTHTQIFLRPDIAALLSRSHIVASEMTPTTSDRFECVSWSGLALQFDCIISKLNIVFKDVLYLYCRDHKAVGRRPFDKMATLLAYLGPPEHKPVADTHWSSLNLTSSKFEEFMTR